MKKERTIKIIGVMQNGRVDKIKTNKYVDKLSNDLSDNNVEHLIVEDSIDGVGIMLIKDAPSLLIHNDKKQRWEYLSKYMEEEKEEPTLAETYVVEDCNKNIDIVDFIKTIIKCSKED